MNLLNTKSNDVEGFDSAVTKRVEMLHQQSLRLKGNMPDLDLLSHKFRALVQYKIIRGHPYAWAMRIVPVIGDAHDLLDNFLNLDRSKALVDLGSYARKVKDRSSMADGCESYPSIFHRIGGYPSFQRIRRAADAAIFDITTSGTSRQVDRRAKRGAVKIGTAMVMSGKSLMYRAMRKVEKKENRPLAGFHRVNREIAHLQSLVKGDASPVHLPPVPQLPFHSVNYLLTVSEAMYRMLDLAAHRVSDDQGSERRAAIDLRAELMLARGSLAYLIQSMQQMNGDPALYSESAEMGIEEVDDRGLLEDERRFANEFQKFLERLSSLKMALLNAETALLGVADQA